MVKKYVPHKGDIIYINFDPQIGREQASRRPALVLSSKIYNEPAALALVCPITSISKNYPFEVKIPEGGKVKGVILADHIKSFDWRGRNARFIEKVSERVLTEVLTKVQILLVS